MFRLARKCLCAATAASVAEGDIPYESRVRDFMAFLGKRSAVFDALEVRPSPENARGLFSKAVLREGTVVASVPVDSLSISADRLWASSPFVQSLAPPTFDDVRRVMGSRSIKDPALYQQVHLALLVAAERMNPESPLSPYFNLLPHPAIDDAKVIELHKGVLDPMLLVEWDDYQKEFLAVLHILLRRWGPKAPPIEVAYWAFRTVLSRIHMLPNEGLAPEDMGSSLNYTALSLVDEVSLQTKWMKRVRRVIGSAFGNLNAAQEYYLVPTLVPLIDMTDHISSSNVQVEVRKRPGMGSCVELQAIRQIEKGEEVGLRYNSSQSPAFCMYRFGFIPQ